MRHDELTELHFITSIANVPSILLSGVLSHRRAARYRHESVAMQEIQARRARVVVPGGRLLHEYANLYICARNPMLYRLQGQHRELCVLRISTDVLNLPDVVIADQNASSNYVRFAVSPDGLALVDYEMVFAEYWTHPGDNLAEWRHKSVKCAEVLVPDSVAPEYIMGAYVSCEESRRALQQLPPDVVVEVDAHLFFLARR